MVLLSRALILSSIFWVLAAPVSATVLSPGSGASPDVFGSIPGPLLDKITLTLPTTGGSASYTAEVVKGTDSSAVCLGGGCLDFIVQISNSATSSFALGRVVEDDFTGFLTDVGYIARTGAAGDLSSPTGGIQPSAVDRGPPGNAIGFDLDITPGSTSDILVTETDALNFTNGLIFISAIPQFTSSFAPATVAPDRVPWLS